MIDESLVPTTLEEVLTRLTNLSIELNNYKELLQDEESKYKRYEVNKILTWINFIIGRKRKKKA